ncbi:MAG TPA: LamG-like jellyroll fold domain-containing protein [Planctomycetota bacterium]|nr:LamG-like jellyroll fold domain-containing protein [Planctomycetota bacterium]
MGREILYCGACHGQVRGADFENDKALRIGSEVYCPKCAKGKLASLFPEEAQEVLRQNRKSEAARSNATSAIPLEKDRPPISRRFVAGGTPRTSRLVITLSIAAAAILVVVFLALPKRAPIEEPPRPALPKAAVRPDPGPVGAVDPDNAARQKKEETARAALGQARDYARLHPEDLEGQLGRFDQAAWIAKDSSLDFDARKERAAALAQLQAGIVAALAAVDSRLKAACEREAFRSALSDLEDSRKRYASPDWTSAIDQKARELRDLATRLFAPLRDKAVEARRRGADEEITRIEERLARWGLDDLGAELARALSEVKRVTAEPPVAPELAAYRSAWESALSLASLRDGGGAVRVLEAAAAPLQGDLKAEAAADLELLRLLAAFDEELRQIPGRFTKGQKVSLACFDDDGLPMQATGSFLKVDAGRLELKKDDQTFSLLIGEIQPSFWAEQYRSRPARKPAQDERAIALFLLLEGDPSASGTIRSKPELKIPEKYLASAARRRALAALPESVDAEKRARAALSATEHELLLPATRALGALRCRELLDKSADVRLVARNRAALAARRDAGKDYVFLAEDLSAGGTFHLSVAKTGSSWISEAPSDAAHRKENYVEVRFSVLPETEYRAWLYVGGCCAETLTFLAQGTQMTMAAADAPLPAEPGGDAAIGIKHGLAPSTKSHSAHAGKKPPLKWGWVEIALPKYASPGTKILRVVTEQQGFSVATATVSSTRSAPPGDVEIRDLLKVRSVEAEGLAGQTSRLVPLSSLAAWYRADQGVVMNGATVSEWKDQSPHGRHAVQTTAAHQPSILPNACNGKPALVFDGNAKNLLANIPVNGLGGVTLILVTACDQDDDLMPRCSPLLWGETAGWGLTHLAPRKSAVVFMFGTGQAAIVHYPRPAPATGFVLTTARKDGATESLFANGVQVWSEGGRRPSLQGASPAVALGGDFNGSFFNGKIAEVMVYERALQDAERQRAEQYLKLKYRLN